MRVRARTAAGRPPGASRAGFTLAEVAVTLVIVAIGLTLVQQGLSTALFNAAHTNYRKVARDLGLLTLGRLEAGLFLEELDGSGDLLTGSFADEGFEDFHYELVVGDQGFLDDTGDRQSGYYDTWAAERARQERLDDRQDQEDEEVEQPFEKVRIKIVFPKLGERSNELVLERWMPWELVHGSQADEKASGP